MPSRISTNLPSLVHPILSSAKTDQGSPILTFPEIQSGWDGFYLDHLHCVGFQEASIKSSVNNWLFQLIYLHEDTSHWSLGGSIVSRMVRINMLEMWTAIRKLCEGQEYLRAERSDVVQTRPLTVPILVPLRSNSSHRLYLHQLAKKLVDLHILAEPVQEVFAVWGSLFKAVEHHLLFRTEVKNQEEAYKDVYETRIRGFTTLYNEFKKIANQLGFDSAYVLILAALSTSTPKRILKDMIKRAERLLKQGVSLENPDVAIDVFMEGEKEYSGFPEADMEKLERGYEDELLKDWLCGFLEPLYCSFDSKKLHFYQPEEGIAKIPLFEWIWLESLRQQLTQGRGVWCPLWDGENCCPFRTRLEGFWMHTALRSEEQGSWKREGCLKE